MIENFVNSLNLNEFLSNVFTLSLVVCLFLHLMLTKQKRLVSFCMFLVILQFVNWLLNPLILGHPLSKYIWYITWMITDTAILLYVAIKGVTTGKVLKEEFAVCILTLIAFTISIGRYIERHFTEFVLIRDIQGYALQAVNICILIVLTLPIVKQLAMVTGKHLNGITVFGFRFSVSRVQANKVLTQSKSPSKRKIL